ncbi:hypothetical protein GCM10009113_34240 [Marinobacter szutsaonensis]
MNSRFFALCLLFVTGPLFAGTEINSYFGFNAVLPSGWVQVGPTAASTMEVDDFAKGSPINKETLNQIREKVAGKEVEFFYDIQSLESEFKLNISVQKSEPVLVDSLKELNSECSGLPEALEEVYGEPIDIKYCEARVLNKWAVFRYVYVVPSQEIMIINDTLPVDGEHSLIIVGGAPVADKEGLQRVLPAQQSLLEGLTNHLLHAQMETKK